MYLYLVYQTLNSIFCIVIINHFRYFYLMQGCLRCVNNKPMGGIKFLYRMDTWYANIQWFISFLQFQPLREWKQQLITYGGLCGQVVGTSESAYDWDHIFGYRNLLSCYHTVNREVGCFKFQYRGWDEKKFKPWTIAKTTIVD